MTNARSVVWVHADCLDPRGPALTACPGAPAIFVFDDVVLEGYQISLKRIAFISSCLLDLPFPIRRGDVAKVVSAFAVEHGAARVVTSETPTPRFAVIAAEIGRMVPVDPLPVPPFVDLDDRVDLGRFSRYWRQAERLAFKRGPTAEPDAVRTLTLPGMDAVG
ncbi:MAG: hypothetical protein ACR2OO_15150 [Thermomicrobiales bacterium]